MKIKINQTAELVKILIEGNLESTTIKPFTDKIAAITGYGKDVELDMGQIEYIDSSGIRSLLTISKKLADVNKNFTIINCSDNLKRILQLSSLQCIK